MVEANRFRLGLFVIAGIVLFTAALFMFGLSELFAPKAKFVTLFDESVQGLEPGSPVKYKGATIGSVRKITIRITDKLIRVDMDINPENLIMDSSEYRNWRKQFYAFFRHELKLGLRCRLEYAGITGMKYIDLDYYPDSPLNDKITPLPSHGDEFLYIPSHPSMLNDMLTMISHSLEKISKIEFDKISEELTMSLAEMRKLLSDPNLAKTLEQLQRTSANIEKSSAEFKAVFTKKQIDGIINRWNNTLNLFDRLLNTSQQKIEEADIKAALERFNAAAEAWIELQNSLEESLDKVNLTLDSITQLSSYLESDPAAILRGKSCKPLQYPLEPAAPEKH